MNINTFDMFNQVEDSFSNQQMIGDLLREIYGETYRTQEELAMENTREITTYECPSCHQKYTSVTDMANCILRDEKNKVESEKKYRLAVLKDKIDSTTKTLESLIKEYNSLSDTETYSLNVKDNCTKTCKCGDGNCNDKKKAKVYSLNDKDIEEWLKEFSKELSKGGNIFTKWLED